MSKCTFKYKNKEYSRQGLLAKLAADLSAFSDDSIEFLKTKLGMSDSEIMIVSGLIDRGSLGRFKADGRIILSNMATDNVVYHEAFHRVYRACITPKEREQIQKQFRKRTDWQSKIDKYRKNYPNATENELVEEFLADEFSDYILNNGDIKIDPVVRSVFDRIIDFIKKLLGLKNRSVYDLYADINKGKYTKMLPEELRYRRNADKIVINGNEYTAEVKNEFIQTVTREFLNDLFSTGTVYDLLAGKFEYNLDELYKDAIVRIVSVIVDEHPELSNDILDDIAKGDSSYINKQFELYMGTLGINVKFKNVIKETDQDESEKELGEQGEVNIELGRQHDDANPQWVSSFHIDPKTSMSKAIKLLLATFEDSENVNSLGLYSQVRWTKAFNKIAQYMAGVPTSKAIEHLAQMSDPWVPELIERLGGINPDVNSISHETMRLRNEFIKTFAKTLNTYAIMSIEDKNIKWFDANQNTKDKKKLQEWNNNMVRAINDNGGFEEWFNRVTLEIIDSKNPSEDTFIELFGIDVEDSIKDEPIVGSDTYMTLMKKLAIIVRDNVKKKNFNGTNLPDYNNLFNEKNLDIKGTLEQIALAQSEFEQVVDLMVNSRGKRLYGIALNTHTTFTVNTLNYISSLMSPDMSLTEKITILEEYLPGLVSYQNISFDGKEYKIRSKWLEHIFNGNKIDVIIVDGVKTTQGDESSVSDLDESDLLAVTLNTSVSGINMSIKHSDRSVYYGYRLQGNPIFDYQQVGAANQEDVLDYLTLVFQDQLNNEVKRSNMENIPLIQFFERQYKNSQLFDLHNIEKLNPYSNEIKKLIRERLGQELKNYHDTLDKWKVKETGVSPELLKRHNGSVDLLVANSFANQVMTHLEEMRIFVGDFAFFSSADDFYKRMATTSGTGDMLVNDQTTNDYIQSLNDFSFEITNPRTGQTQQIRYDKRIDGKFSVLTLYENKNYQSTLTTVKDKISPIDGREVNQAVFLFEKNMLLDGVNPEKAKELAEAYASNYETVNENDGQSWVNMFFYREYMMRLGQWSREMNNLFLAEVKILNAKTYADLKNIQIEIDGEMVDVFDWKNWEKGLFEPVNTLKAQYAGFNQSYMEYRKSFEEANRFDERIRPYTIYKTSFHVLWPSTVFGTNLSQVHHFMLKNKIDLLAMASANKTGSIDVQKVFKQRYDELNDDQRNVADHGFNFYDQYGHFNDFVFENELGQELLDHSVVISNIDSLKDQVHIGNHEKDEIRGSTQSLKILLSNLIVNGQERFPGAQALVDRYTEVVKRLVDKNVNDLKDEFGFDQGAITKIDSLVQTIKKAAEERSSPINIIEAIEGFLSDPYIETLPNKTKIENIFYSIITNNAIVFNRPGNSYPQVAATGFEPHGTRHILEPSGMKISTQSDLKFYSIETDSEGNITKVNPAEVMIPIPQKWIPSILKRYKTTNIIEAITQLNDDIERGVVDTDVTFKGLRIPNQQLSSNDIIKVKKFMPPTNNNYVVVPSELVTKVGADSSLKFA